MKMFRKWLPIGLFLFIANPSWGSAIAIENLEDVQPVYSRVNFFWSSCGKELNELALDLKRKKPIEQDLLIKIFHEIQKKPTSITEEALDNPSSFRAHINQSIKFLENNRDTIEDDGINYILFLNELKIIKFLSLKMK